MSIGLMKLLTLGSMLMVSISLATYTVKVFSGSIPDGPRISFPWWVWATVGIATPMYYAGSLIRVTTVYLNEDFNLFDFVLGSIGFAVFGTFFMSIALYLIATAFKKFIANLNMVIN